LGSDEVVDCFGWVVGAENCGVVGYDVDYAGDEEGGEPEGTDGREEEGNPFCAELLDEELDVRRCGDGGGGVQGQRGFRLRWGLWNC
jgi:hypothetical protein